ncbi:MAG: hypothetical protein R2734_17710 [Nocardioides sp.]
MALLQAAIVYVSSIVLFRVDWGSPPAVVLLCVGMSLVGTGGRCCWAPLRRSQQQVGAIGLLLSLCWVPSAGRCSRWSSLSPTRCAGWPSWRRRTPG